MGTLLVPIALAGCAGPAVPPIGAGRPFSPEPDELALWREADRDAERVLRAIPRYDDAALDDYLAGLAARLVPAPVRAAGGPPVRVAVLRDPRVNAFALPNGRVYVSTGALAHLESEAELAAVLAHELAHVTERHALAVIRADRRWPGGPPRRAMADVPANPFRALGLGVATLAAVDGYGRQRERSADARAVERMIDAGYDPAAGPRAYLALGRDGEPELDGEPFYLGQAGRLTERAASMQAQVTRVGPVPAGAPLGADRFAERTRGVLRDNALLEARAHRFASARGQLDRALRLRPDDPVAHLNDGELQRLLAQRTEDAAGRRRLELGARAAYERAAALDPAYAEPWRQLGLLHYQQQEPARAREAFRRYLAINPDAADARRIREYIAELER